MFLHAMPQGPGTGALVVQDCLKWLLDIEKVVAW